MQIDRVSGDGPWRSITSAVQTAAVVAAVAAMGGNMWAKPEFEVVEACAEASGYFFRR